MLTLQVVLVLAAVIAFGLATFGVPGKVNWIGLGLLLWSLSGLLR